MRKTLSILALLAILLTTLPASASEPGKALNSSYTIDYWGEAQPAPPPYEVEIVLSGSSVGTGDFSDPSDVCFDIDGCLYVADSANNRIVKLNADLSFAAEFRDFGEAGTLSRPQGVFVTPGGDIYIADTENARIIRAAADGTLLAVFAAPADASIPVGFTYRPTRLAVDEAGRLYVVAAAMNRGIIVLEPDGGFEGFLSAAKVNASIADVLWKRFSTDAQRNRMQSFVPTEYNSVDIDAEGFLYTTTSAVQSSVIITEITKRKPTEKGSPIRRLNINGQDVLRRKGYWPTVGDVNIPAINDAAATFSGLSVFVDIAAMENGSYIALDNKHKRLFCYDEEGFLLFAYGGLSASSGGFNIPIAIAVYGDKLVVADKGNSLLTILKRTQYGHYMFSAINSYAKGEYAQSESAWQKVAALNANNEVAYIGMGRSAYRDERYEDAMRYFELGGNKTWYSKAYAEHRNVAIARYMPWFAAALLSLLAVSSALQAARYIRRVKRGEVDD